MIKVAIVRGVDPQGITVKALNMVDAKDSLPVDKPILIKPNYINDERALACPLLFNTGFKWS
jgi:hypothetical protein